MLSFVNVLFIDTSEDTSEDSECAQRDADIDDGSDGTSVRSTPSRAKMVRVHRTNASPSLARKESDAPSAQKRKRSQPSPKTLAKEGVKKLKTPNNRTEAYTIEGIKLRWSEETDYGLSFRAMTEGEQLVEVRRLNKGVEKGMKSLMKTKLLDSNYTKMVAGKLEAHLSGSRAPQVAMFHAPPSQKNVVMHDINFISVGEWVEVDVDRTPGFNSEGGIAVIINVQDDLADVKYVKSQPLQL